VPGLLPCAGAPHPPCVTVVRLGGGGGVQFSEPESVALRPPSAVALAAGFGCDVQAPAGVLASDTVMVTELPALIDPRFGHESRLDALIVHALGGTGLTVIVAPDQFSPPAVGSWSLSATCVATLPACPSFETTIVNDTGPPDNLGEGSVLLNMKLRGVTSPPTSKKETFSLSIENAQVLVAIIPGSKSFQVARPYTAENIDARVTAWQRDAGFASPNQFIEAIKSFATSLK